MLGDPRTKKRREKSSSLLLFLFYFFFLLRCRVLKLFYRFLSLRTLFIRQNFFVFCIFFFFPGNFSLDTLASGAIRISMIPTRVQISLNLTFCSGAKMDKQYVSPLLEMEKTKKKNKKDIHKRKVR